MTLGSILAAPRTAGGIGSDPRTSLAALAARLGSSHPLAQAVRRADQVGRAPRDLELAPGFRLFDVGGRPGDDGEVRTAGLLLGLPDAAGPLDPLGSDLDPDLGLDLGQDPLDPDAAVEHAAWIAWGLPVPSVNLFLAPALRRLSSSLPSARTRRHLDELLASRDFAECRVPSRVLVEDALTPLSYRVYPDTPVAELQHLMLRRALSVVPVVGGRREVLGVVAASDVLPHILPRREDEPTEAADLVAKDIMNRSVLCVAADEGLAEAGRSMVKRGVAQLPVVRDGEMIGFLGRAAVMRAFAQAVPSRSSVPSSSSDGRGAGATGADAPPGRGRDGLT